MSILIDPSSIQCLDFTQDFYTAARANLINDCTTDAMAATQLADMWNTINTAEQARYQIQFRQEEEDNEQRLRVLQEARDLQDREDAKEKQEQANEERKKNKAKYMPVPQRGIPTQLPVLQQLPHASLREEILFPHGISPIKA